MRGDSMMFTYFPVAAVTGLSVTRIRPLGGPSAGGTLVHLRGARLTNLGGQHCLFSTSLEPAPATWLGFEHLTCLSPRLPTPTTLPISTAAGYKSISTRVLVSVNGVLTEVRVRVRVRARVRVRVTVTVTVRVRVRVRVRVEVRV